MHFDDPKNGMSLLMALLMASCCATAPKIERDLPSASLLAPCPDPSYDRSTNGGLADGLQRYKEALGLCNADKSALREWAK